MHGLAVKIAADPTSDRANAASNFGVGNQDF